MGRERALLKVCHQAPKCAEAFGVKCSALVSALLAVPLAACDDSSDLVETQETEKWM